MEMQDTACCIYVAVQVNLYSIQWTSDLTRSGRHLKIDYSYCIHQKMPFINWCDLHTCHLLVRMLHLKTMQSSTIIQYLLAYFSTACFPFEHLLINYTNNIRHVLQCVSTGQLCTFDWYWNQQLCMTLNSSSTVITLSNAIFHNYY